MVASTIRVAIAYHSGFGHTAKQAEAVARGAASVPGVHAELHNVAELTDDLWAALDRADAIIFGSPTYMGSPSTRIIGDKVVCVPRFFYQLMLLATAQRAAVRGPRREPYAHTR